MSNDDEDWEELHIEPAPVKYTVTFPKGDVVPESPAEQWQKLVERRRGSKILVGRLVITMIATTAAFGAGATLGVAFAVGKLGPVALVGVGFVVIVVFLVVLAAVWLVDD